jgi:hypothetical protein
MWRVMSRGLRGLEWRKRCANVRWKLGILLAYSPSGGRPRFDAIQSVEEMHLDVGFDQCTVATG